MFVKKLEFIIIILVWFVLFGAAVISKHFLYLGPTHITWLTAHKKSQEKEPRFDETFLCAEKNNMTASQERLKQYGRQRV